ncbi:MAG: F5/8 type C domain protein [Firmicutes bacterium ADurb.Bin182]|nr:MAG: F5/8 type C domain protein [Firmicutes bacterium ADurb.Bin182]
MTKKLTIVFCSVIAFSIIIATIAFFGLIDSIGLFRQPTVPGLTIVKAPDQSEVTRPEGFPDPEANWVKLPDGANLAEGKEVTAGEVTEVYTATNAVDGDTLSYWESKGVPAEITIDLEGTYTVRTVAVRLNPAPIWEARTQNFAILISGDGENFTAVTDDTKYEFNPDTGNMVRIDISPVKASYVRLVFSSNSSARSKGAQAAEILIFE